MDVAALVKLALDVEGLRAEPGEAPRVDQAPTKVSEIDLNAVEEAVSIRERVGGSVTAFSVLNWGPLSRRMREAREAAKRVLAMGADRFVLVADEAAVGADTGFTAAALAAALRARGPFDLVLAGEGTEDSFGGLVPGRLAQELGWPYVPYADGVEVGGGGSVRVRRAVGDFEEVVEVDLPAVISVTQEINKPRIPTLMQILQAGKKPLEVLSLSDLGLPGPGAGRGVRVSSVVSPRVERRGVVIEAESPREAAERLVEELRRAGVI